MPRLRHARAPSPGGMEGLDSVVLALESIKTVLTTIPKLDSSLTILIDIAIDIFNTAQVGRKSYQFRSQLLNPLLQGIKSNKQDSMDLATLAALSSASLARNCQLQHYNLLDEETKTMEGKYVEDLRS
jgi:hypothetical protein